MQHILIEIDGTDTRTTNCPEGFAIALFDWNKYDTATEQRKAEMLLAIPSEFHQQIVELLPDGSEDEGEE